MREMADYNAFSKITNSSNKANAWKGCHPICQAWDRFFRPIPEAPSLQPTNKSLPRLVPPLLSNSLPTSACACSAVPRPVAASPAPASWVLCLRAGFLSTWKGRLDTTQFSHALSSVSCAGCTKNPRSAQGPTYKHGSAGRSHGNR